MKKAEKTTNKLEEQEYNNLKDLVTKINENQSRLGGLELAKHELLHDAAVTKEALTKIQTELREKYGNVTIDIETGEYKENKEEE